MSVTKCPFLGCDKMCAVKNGQICPGCCKFHSCVITDPSIDQTLCMVKDCTKPRNYQRGFLACSKECADQLGLICLSCQAMGAGYCRCNFAYGDTASYKYTRSKIQPKK